MSEAIALRLAEAGADLYLVDTDIDGMNTVRDGIKTRFNRKSLSFKWIYLEKKGLMIYGRK